MAENESQELPAQPLQAEGWRFWRFNPRFYRPRDGKRLYPEVYWVFGFEFLAMAVLGLAVYYFSIRPRLGQHGKDLEVYQRLRQVDSGSGISPNSVPDKPVN